MDSSTITSTNPTPFTTNFNYCNIKGFSSNNNLYDIHEVIARLQKFDTDIFSLNKINIDISKHTLKYKMNKLICQQDKHCRVSHGIMQFEQSRGAYKPGRTMVGVMGRWSSCIHNMVQISKEDGVGFLYMGKREKRFYLFLPTGSLKNILLKPLTDQHVNSNINTN